MNGFSPYIAQASEIAGQVDELLLALTVISVLVIGIVVLLITLFALRYRRGTPRARAVERGELTIPRDHRLLETLWIGATLLVFLGLFYWAATLYAALRNPPEEALVIDVVAKQWLWKVQHPSGQRELNELHLPVGQTVKLVMTSQDVIHSFFMPAFRIKQDVLPGRYTTLWFEPKQVGEYRLFCAEFCGTDHSRMRGRIVVMPADAYQRWLEAHPGPGSLVEQGGRLFRSRGCSGCHDPRSTVHAPNLAGIFGRQVPLMDGRMVTVDARYIRDSILLPQKEVAAGYAPIMPSFEGQLDEAEILQLIAYIQSLGGSSESSP